MAKAKEILEITQYTRAARLMRIYPTCSTDSAPPESQRRASFDAISRDAQEVQDASPFLQPGQVNIIIHGIVPYYNERIPTGMSCCVSAVARRTTATYVGLLDAEIRRAAGGA